MQTDGAASQLDLGLDVARVISGFVLVLMASFCAPLITTARYASQPNSNPKGTVGHAGQGEQMNDCCLLKPLLLPAPVLLSTPCRLAFPSLAYERGGAGLLHACWNAIIPETAPPATAGSTLDAKGPQKGIRSTSTAAFSFPPAAARSGAQESKLVCRCSEKSLWAGAANCAASTRPLGLLAALLLTRPRGSQVITNTMWVSALHTACGAREYAAVARSKCAAVVVGLKISAACFQPRPGYAKIVVQ